MAERLLGSDSMGSCLTLASICHKDGFLLSPTLRASFLKGRKRPFLTTIMMAVNESLMPSIEHIRDAATATFTESVCHATRRAFGRWSCLRVHFGQAFGFVTRGRHSYPQLQHFVIACFFILLILIIGAAMKSSLFPTLLLALSLAAPVSATHKTTAPAAHSTKAKKPPKSKCSTCARDSHGKIKRSKEAVKAFEKASGYPHGRKGFVIDHVVPLACGGLDVPENLQWQSKAEAAAKDKWERNTCTH
jgi:hypothetical protein